jgi:allophanate hydrolase subunit 1
MHVRFSDEILKCMAKHVHEARTARGILDVYASAESIRLEYISENIAREDIIERLVALASSAFVPVEFNKHEIASDGAYYEPTSYLNEDSLVLSTEHKSVH